MKTDTVKLAELKKEYAALYQERSKLKQTMVLLVSAWDKIPATEPVPEAINEPELWDRARALIKPTSVLVPPS